MANLYLAGPMTGIEAFNYPAFARAAERFRTLGHRVVSPAEVGAQHDGGTRGSIRHADYLRHDLRELLSCDAIAVLPNWAASSGARLEVAIGTALGFTFYDAGTGLLIGEVMPPLDDVKPLESRGTHISVDVLSAGMLGDMADVLVAAKDNVRDAALQKRIGEVLDRAQYQSDALVERRTRVLREQRDEQAEAGIG